MKIGWYDKMGLRMVSGTWIREELLPIFCFVLSILWEGFLFKWFNSVEQIGFNPNNGVILNEYMSQKRGIKDFDIKEWYP